MKLLTQLKSTSQKGFTLIELLVVIGILGILASALVATIDPFEQLNKAQDANFKNVSVEFLNANLRYYTTHSYLPWDPSADSGLTSCAPSGARDLSNVDLGKLTDCINRLVSEGELKQGFSSFNGLTNIFVTEPNPQTGRPNDTIVCFQPKSKSQQKDKATKYLINGDNGSGCISTGGTTACYWCAQ